MKNNTTQDKEESIGLSQEAMLALTTKFLVIEIFLDRLMEVTPAPECKEQAEVMELGKELQAQFKSFRKMAGIEVQHNFFSATENN